ncbi:DUF7159 family protein [Mycobacterium sherrisii]
MDIVLGVSVAPTSVHMVMLQGETADGPTIDENEFPITSVDSSRTISASDRVIAAIECTREDAAGAGLALDSIGVACTDRLEAAALRDALAAHKIENVMLVSAFVAAAALTQSVGAAMGYERTAVLFVEPGTATLAVVDTVDGSVDDVHTAPLDADWAPTVTAELVALMAGLDDVPTPPGALFVVGSGVDVTGIGRRIGEVTSLVVNMPEEPETALARGAALASAHALASPTTATAYAQDPGTGAVDVSSLPEYLHITDTELSDDGLAYSAVADEEADAATTVIAASDGAEPRRRPALLVGTGVAIAGFSAALALEIALSIGMQTTVDSLPAPIRGIIAPVQQALLPAPDVALKMVAPAPLKPAPLKPVPVAPAPAAPAVAVPAAPPVTVPAAPVPAAPAPQIEIGPVPPIHMPAPPASPPMVDTPSSPPIFVPPPKSPHRPPTAQNPPPSSGGGGSQGSGQHPTGGGPTNGTGPGQSAPGVGSAPDGQTPTGSGPSGGGANPSDGGPTGVASPGGGAPSIGGPASGGQTPSEGGPASPGGIPSTGAETPSGSGPSVNGSSGSDPGSGSLSGSSSSGGSESGSSSSGGSESSSSSSSSSSGAGSESSSGSSSSR